MGEFAHELIPPITPCLPKKPGLVVQRMGLGLFLRCWPSLQKRKRKRCARLRGLLQGVRSTKRDRASHTFNRPAIQFVGLGARRNSNDSSEAAHETSPDISSAKAA